MLIREVWLRQVKLCLRHSEVLRLCRNVKLSAPQHLRSKLHRAATSRCEASLQAPRGALRSKKTALVYQTNAVFFVVPLTGSRESRCCRRRDRRQANVPRTSAFGSFESGRSECRKGTSRRGCSFSGAADRTRTGTELPPADFKSAVSTIPPQRHIP